MSRQSCSSDDLAATSASLAAVCVVGPFGQHRLLDVWRCPYEPGDVASSPNANAIAWAVMPS